MWIKMMIKELIINSEYENIKFTRDKIRRIIFEQNIPKVVGFAVEVALGEVLVNIIDYGLKNASDTIKLEIKIDFEKKVEIVFMYQGNPIPLDIIEEYRKIKLVENIEDVHNRGRGIFLIEELMDEVEYKNLPNNNVLIRIIKNI